MTPDKALQVGIDRLTPREGAWTASPKESRDAATTLAALQEGTGG